MGTFHLHFYPILFNCFFSTLIWTSIEPQPLSFLPTSSFLFLRYFLFKGICSPSPHASVSSEAPVLVLTQPVELGKEPSLSTRNADLSLPSLESFTGSTLTLGVQETLVAWREPMLCPGPPLPADSPRLPASEGTLESTRLCSCPESPALPPLCSISLTG